MNLKDKLRRLDSTNSGITESNGDASISDWIGDFQRELDAKIISEKNSFIILKENIFPAFEYPEFIWLKDRAFQLKNLSKISTDSLPKSQNLKDLIFFDLETTGLAGGTGTYAFLIGLGHIELDQVVVRQYLLPDFQHEWLMLKLVDLAFQKFAGLVSFNGKSFDLPLLCSRFVLNRLDGIMEDMPHIDLLHPARRLWKERLVSCTLQNLEREILNYHRTDDIPGELIPQVYFDFIRKKNAWRVRDVLEHNYYDIANLVMILIKMEYLLDIPIENIQSVEDKISLAKYLFKSAKYKTADEIFSNILDENIGKNTRNEIYLKRFLCCKKLGETEKGVVFLEKIVRSNPNHFPAVEELAKFYEHTKKNPGTALAVLENYLQNDSILQQLNRIKKNKFISDTIAHRKKRLLKKLARLET